MYVRGLLSAIAFLFVATVQGAYSANTLWAPYWMRTGFLSSLVQGDYLYLTGGAQSVTSKSRPNLWNESQYVGSLMRIDLTSAWKTSTVTAEYSDLPDQYPYSRRPTMWSDGTYIYTFGGIPMVVLGCTSNCVGALWHGGTNVTIPSQRINPKLLYQPQVPWRVPIDSFGHKSWQAVPRVQPSRINPPQGALTAAHGAKQYALGGFGGWPYWTQYLPNGNPDYNGKTLYNRQGLVSWNSDGSGWQNQSSVDFSQNGAISLGSAVATPFGPEGTLIFLGGYSGYQNRSFAYGSYAGPPLQNLSLIPIYDIKSKQFTHQTATGEIPAGRWNPCMVGVAEAGNKTFDIYFYGGATQDSIYATYSSSVASIYVLSLPSFVWTLVEPGRSNDMRMSHACQVVGNSQMLVLGGTNPMDQGRTGATQDPWPNGIGIYDLNSLKWKEDYDPDASVYKRSGRVLEAVEKTPFPKQWNSNFPKMLFRPAAEEYDPPEENVNKGGKNQSEDSDGINIGAIVGGVVGGCLLLSLMIGIALCWRWRRKAKEAERQRMNDAEAEAEARALKMRKSELPGHESKGAILLGTYEKPLELSAMNKSLPATPSDSSDNIPARLFELPTAMTKSSSGSMRTEVEEEFEKDETVQSPGSIQKTPRG